MLFIALCTLISTLQSQRALAVENLTLRHQLLVLQRNTKKPRLRGMDRILWVLLSRLWSARKFEEPPARWTALALRIAASHDHRGPARKTNFTERPEQRGFLSSRNGIASFRANVSPCAELWIPAGRLTG